MRVGIGSMAALLAAAAVLLASGPGVAELQRVEAVGIYGIRDAMRSRVIPRDEAISKARWEGVSRVALELIGESGSGDVAGADGKEPGGDDSTPPPIEVSGADPLDGPSDDEMVALRAALGKDVLPYMRSYRILDDRGEVPVLFNDEPNVSVEYVVVVEVIVDVDRVTSALQDAGLIATLSSPGREESVVVELIGLSRFEAFEVVLAALRTKFTLEKTRGLQRSPPGPRADRRRLRRSTNSVDGSLVSRSRWIGGRLGAGPKTRRDARPPMHHRRLRCETLL